jgi:hypothetical protein
MPIPQTTDEFIQLLKDNSLFAECELANHPDSCCDTINTMVLNFDEISKLFFSKLNINKLSSVDAVYISKDKKKLYLIEMKKKSSKKAIEAWVAKQMRAGEIQKQMIESVLTIIGILGWHKCHDGHYPYFLNSEEIKINAVFLCNCDYRDLSRLQKLNLQHRTFKYTNIIGKFEWYNSDSIQDFFTNN